MSDKQLVVGVAGGPYARYEELQNAIRRFDPVVVNADKAIFEAIDAIADYSIRRHRLADFEVKGRVSSLFHYEAIFTERVLRDLQVRNLPLVIMGFPLSLPEDVSLFRLKHPEWELRVLVPPPCPHRITIAEQRPEERSRMANFIEWKVNGRNKFRDALSKINVPVELVDTLSQRMAEDVLIRQLEKYQSSTRSV